MVFKLILGLGSLLGASVALKITAHTTAGCSDTVNWIQNQLVPTYQEFSQYLEVDFVPWGRTIANVDGSLTCQFGVADCWANRVHRCALNVLRDDQQARVNYMNCEFINLTDRPALQLGSYSCAVESGVNVVELDYCVSSSSGDVLADEAQILAVAPMQVINFVPAIVFDDAPEASILAAAFTNLRQTVCQLLVLDPNVPIASC